MGLTPARRWNHFNPLLALSFLAHRNAGIVLMHIPKETLIAFKYSMVAGGWRVLVMMLVVDGRHIVSLS